MSMYCFRWPNQALEATPDGAFSSAVAGLAFWPGVPQFCRYWTE
jgi:hypothetical protein